MNDEHRIEAAGDTDPFTVQDRALAVRTRELLRTLDPSTLPITYRTLAQRLALEPPHTIHQLTTALEILMHEDAAAGLPLIAALVTSRWRGGLPAPGFFALATRLGRHDGAEHGAAAEAFHRREFAAAVERWCGARRDAD